MKGGLWPGKWVMVQVEELVGILGPALHDPDIEPRMGRRGLPTEHKLLAFLRVVCHNQKQRVLADRSNTSAKAIRRSNLSSHCGNIEGDRCAGISMPSPRQWSTSSSPRSRAGATKQLQGGTWLVSERWVSQHSSWLSVII